MEDVNNQIRQLYKEKKSSLDSAEKIEHEKIKKLWKKIFKEFALSCLWQTPKTKEKRTKRIVETVQKNNIFPMVVESEPEFENCDLYFGNHQGGVNETGGKGDSPETLFIHALVPGKARIVLKQSLVYPEREVNFNTLSKGQKMKKKIMARGLKNLNPIVVERDDEDFSREGILKLSEEMKRVAQKICDVVWWEKKPVVLYPEGTRSNTGEILPFKREFFEKIFSEYLIPCVKNKKPVRIGLLISDTLQTFPKGFSPSIDAYKRPLQMKGFVFDAEPFLQKIQQECPEFFIYNAIVPEKEWKKWANLFKEEVRQQMQKKLLSVLQE